MPGMKSQKSFAVPVSVSHVNMCRTQILTTLQTFRQQIMCSHTRRQRPQDCQRNFLPRRPILPTTSEPIAPLRFSWSLTLVWMRPTRGLLPSVRQNFPSISYHVHLLALNSVPRTRSPQYAQAARFSVSASASSSSRRCSRSCQLSS